MSTTSEKRAEFGTFYNVFLRPSEKPAWEQWHDEEFTDSLPELLADMAENGYSISIRQDRRKGNVTTQISVMAYYADCVNKGDCLTCRNDDWQTALSQALYYHYHIVMGLWGG